MQASWHCGSGPLLSSDYALIIIAYKGILLNQLSVSTVSDKTAKPALHTFLFLVKWFIFSISTLLFFLDKIWMESLQ